MNIALGGLWVCFLLSIHHLGTTQLLWGRVSLTTCAGPPPGQPAWFFPFLGLLVLSVQHNLTCCCNGYGLRHHERRRQ